MRYRWLSVQNFRCFETFQIANLERLNLIVGPNNVGKTALLEALYVHAGDNPFDLALARGMSLSQLKDEPWQSLDFLFAKKRSKEPIVLENEERIVQLHKVSLSDVDDPNVLRRLHTVSYEGDLLEVRETKIEQGDRWLQRRYVSRHALPRQITPSILVSKDRVVAFLTTFSASSSKSLAELFGELEIKKQAERVVQALKQIEPRLQDLTTVVHGREAMLYCDIGLNDLIPLSLMGDGMVRLARLVLAIGTMRGGVVLVDEIENGFYYAVLPMVWRVLRETTRVFDVQLFATTHSLECIQAAYQAFAEEMRDDFRLHRLERTPDGIEPVTFDIEHLQVALERGWEIR
nr:ATP-binding protein [Ardenticatena sp.]